MSSSDSVRQDALIPPAPGNDLSPEEMMAIDAVFEHGIADPTRLYAVGSPAGTVARLLTLLDSVSISHTERETLIEATVARVVLESHRRAADAEAVLVPDDEDALEALVSAEFQLARVPAAMRERASRHMALLGLLEAPAPATGNAEEVVEATLARVQALIDSQEGRMTIAQGAGRSERGGLFSFVRSREILSVAALLLIATALLTPLAQYAREYARRTACTANMAAAGIAFEQYAASNQDRLPLASASRPGTLFWNVGQREQSNSANLFLLRVLNFATVDELACPGQLTDGCRSLGEDAQDWQNLRQVSVSFQNMFARERPSWSSNSRAVILADASPVIRRAVLGQVIYPFENSANHMRRGQNVLWSDGSTQWLKSPVLPNNDNIWLPREIENIIAKMTRPHEADPLHGTESPSAPDDAFVGP